jgi:hypothetical protein
MRRLLVLVLAALALAPSSSLADGDPASDTLGLKSYFLPIAPAAATAAIARIDGATTVAEQAGYPVRVAVISGAGDLGAIPEMAGKPQAYADFLAQELQYAFKGPLLIVMPEGYGYHGPASPAVAAAVKALAKPASNDPTVLTNAAADAVKALSAADGHPITIPAAVAPAVVAPASGSGSGSLIAIVVGGGVGVVILLGAAIWWVRRAPVDDSDG